MEKCILPKHELAESVLCLLIGHVPTPKSIPKNQLLTPEFSRPGRKGKQSLRSKMPVGRGLYLLIRKFTFWGVSKIFELPGKQSLAWSLVVLPERSMGICGRLRQEWRRGFKDYSWWSFLVFGRCYISCRISALGVGWAIELIVWMEGVFKVAEESFSAFLLEIHGLKHLSQLVVSLLCLPLGIRDCSRKAWASIPT